MGAFLSLKIKAGIESGRTCSLSKTAITNNATDEFK